MIYLASSWRNQFQQHVLRAMREAGHEVYDFRNPEPGNIGFSWDSIDADWRNWTTELFVEALKHPVAREGFRLDMEALRAATAGVLLLPCNRSAHLEAGYIVGAGHPLFILTRDEEPELMYAMAAAICPDLDSLLMALKKGRVR